MRCDAVLLVAAARQPGRQRAQVQPAGRRRSRSWPGASATQVVLAVRDRGPGIRRRARAHLRGLPARRRSMPGAATATVAAAARRRRRPGGVPRHRPGARRQARLRPRGHGGCSFECTLPVPAASRAQPPEAAPIMSLSVLLVEDDRELRATLRDALARRGLRGADRGQPGRGARAAGACRARAGDGIDLVRARPGPARWRRRRRCSPTCGASTSLPVIVISARQAEGQKIRLLDAGADDYLVKPFSVAELLARMRVALRHRGTALQPALTRYEHGGPDASTCSAPGQLRRRSRCT